MYALTKHRQQGKTDEIQAWVDAQPARYRLATQAFHDTQNTLGGVVGKSLKTIHQQSRCELSFRTFERRVADMQAARVIQKDEPMATRSDAGDFSQRASVWIIRRNRVMPS